MGGQKYGIVLNRAEGEAFLAAPSSREHGVGEVEIHQDTFAAVEESDC